MIHSLKFDIEGIDDNVSFAVFTRIRYSDLPIHASGVRLVLTR